LTLHSKNLLGKKNNQSLDRFIQNLILLLWAAIPPSVPAFFVALRSIKKSSTQVGLRDCAAGRLFDN
jgi:hypothetical protein